MNGWPLKMFLKLRSLLAAASIVAALACQARAQFVPVNGFSDLIVWAGAGANEAGFVLQFSATESPTAIAWGYRWSGSATMQAMMDALAGATSVAGGSPPPSGLDGRLSVAATYYPSFDALFVDSLAYDQAGLPPEWTQATRQIVSDFVTTGTYPALYFKADAGGAWLDDSGSQTMSFSAAQVGITDLVLASGGWYGFVQSTGADPFAFSQPVSAVPEPGTWALVVAVGVLAAPLLQGRPRRLRIRRPAGGRLDRSPRA